MLTLRVTLLALGLVVLGVVALPPFRDDNVVVVVEWVVVMVGPVICFDVAVAWATDRAALCDRPRRLDRSRLDSRRNKVEIFPVKPCFGRGGCVTKDSPPKGLLDVVDAAAVLLLLPILRGGDRPRSPKAAAPPPP